MKSGGVVGLSDRVKMFWWMMKEVAELANLRWIRFVCWMKRTVGIEFHNVIILQAISFFPL